MRHSFKGRAKESDNHVKGAFRNGGEFDSQWIADKISNSMSQARYHDRMKIRAHMRDLNVYRNLERPLQFSKDIRDAFYQSEVQLKAARQLKEVTEQLAKAKKAREFGRSDRDLKALELKVAECQSVVDEVGDPPLKFLKAAERVKQVPNTTHRLGQGGIPGLKAAFVSTLAPSPLNPFLQIFTCL
jgi:predicted RNA-binding Zn ribbon-like protein